MRPFGELTSKDEALRILLALAPRAPRVELASLHDAAGRAAAEDVDAPFDVPPFARSTMDGYAVRSADADAARRLVGEVLAGATSLPPLGPGECARIATGAPLPPGADAVVRVEDAREDQGQVRVRMPPKPRQFVDPAGADLPRGTRVVRSGELLTPARLGLLASVGRAQVRVVARPRVALVSSGDELLRPGEPPAPLRVFDSNTTSLRALLEAAGARVEPQPPLPDELDALRAALREAAASHDLVVFSGGASVGRKDLVVDALRAEGDVAFHGVRVKPGKPLLAGSVADAVVVGLPGNPTSALSNAAIFVAPLVRRLAGSPEVDAPRTRATLGAEVKGEPDRFVFLPVRLEAGRALPTFKGSGNLTSLAGSDGWVGVPEGATLPAGAAVDVTPW